MRFSVDAHAIGCHLTGNEVYVRNLLEEFARLDRDSEILACISKAHGPESVPSRFETRWVSENPYKRLAWDLPRHLRADRPDLLHVQYTGPLGASPTPLVVSIHDVSFLECPEYFTRFRANQLKITVARTAARAARILTPSEFSKAAIIRHYDVPEDRVVVIPNGVSSHFRPIERNIAMAAVEKALGVRGPFVICVGDLQPRKNHLGLLRAFEQVVFEQPELKHRLVFVGKETWYSPRLHQAVTASRVADRVHFAGFVEDDDLVNYYGACDLAVYPSFYEGFGLPILEAMACRRAVACSETTAMPEVADSAALLFNPHNVDEIARAIRDVLIDPDLRARLERLGRQHASTFSWRKSAEQTLNVYYEVAGAQRRIEGVLKAGAV
jgi:glycosyltransferase involved in cell wall biosynthesis